MNQISETDEKPGPLSGITVLDFSRVLAGPYCTMVLADLGARVIKVERFGTGDDTRAFGPFVGVDSAYFMCFNRGKESISLDIKSPRDRELLERLLDSCDVVVENFRPGVMERLGYGPERLEKTHPHIIYTSISGFGHSGPFSELPGYDMVVQAMGGVMSLTGWPDEEPARVGTSFGDLGAALFGVIGILSALYSRTRDAQGTRVDIGMLDCQAALMETALARYDVEGIVPTRTGDNHPSLAPFETFAAKDGKFVICAGNDTLFLLMMDALGSPQLALEERFLTNDLRVQNRKQLVKDVEEITLKNGNKIYLLAKGRLANLVLSEGHPSGVMDMSFGLQALMSEYIVKNKGTFKPGMIPVPKDIDNRVGELKLKSISPTLSINILLLQATPL